ncbi:hypothetical protein KKD49_10400 [Myxococcota bacterium]|nr:hypothetical protein [Myxococcota bacterium]
MASVGCPGGIRRVQNVIRRLHNCRLQVAKRHPSPAQLPSAECKTISVGCTGAICHVQNGIRHVQNGIRRE